MKVNLRFECLGSSICGRADTVTMQLAIAVFVNVILSHAQLS